MQKYVCYNDPAHGWLAVERKEIYDLGIADKVSGYSYQKGLSVFLEEDCDMGLFIKAKCEKAGVEFSKWREVVTVEDRHTNAESFIRQYNRYKYTEGQFNG